jgi:hypothetical protein
VQDKDLILNAFKMLGVVAHVETALDPGLLAVGRTQLQGLIGTWALQSLTVYAWGRHVFPLAAGISEYTLGPGGDFNTARPALGVDLWSIIPDRNAADILEIPRRRPRTIQEWQRIGIKTTTSSLPTDLYFDATIDAANRNTVVVYPVPDNGNVDVVLYLQTGVDQFEGGVDYIFPAAYDAALLNNLAVRLKGFYPDALLDASVYQFAVSDLTLLKRKNWRGPEVFGTAPWSRGGEYSIYEDEYRRPTRW